MKTIISIVLALALATSSFAQVSGFDVCRIGKQDKPTVSLGINWRVFRVDQWWGECSNAERAQAICVAGAWAGTATVLALSPWSENPKVMKWIQIAGCVGVGGLFGNYIIGGLRQRYEGR